MDGQPTDEERQRSKVITTFVKGHTIVQIPAAAGKRRVLLELLAQDFEPGVKYPEHEVNRVLMAWHADYAAWRRYLVEAELLDREAGLYWRCGGDVSVR